MSCKIVMIEELNEFFMNESFSNDSLYEYWKHCQGHIYYYVNIDSDEELAHITVKYRQVTVFQLDIEPVKVKRAFTILESDAVRERISDIWNEINNSSRRIVNRHSSSIEEILEEDKIIQPFTQSLKSIEDSYGGEKDLFIGWRMALYAVLKTKGFDAELVYSIQPHMSKEEKLLALNEIGQEND